MTTMTRSIPDAQAERFGHGMCVAMIENNGYHDSDFSGVFAFPAEGGGYTFSRIETGSTRGGGGFVPVEDATEEVLAAYRARREQVLGELAAETEEIQKEVPLVGRRVTIIDPITRGKNKTPDRAQGEVVWRGNGFQQHWQRANGIEPKRVGVKVDGEERVVFLDEYRVRVVGFEDKMCVPKEGDRMVEYVVAASWPHR